MNSVIDLEKERYQGFWISIKDDVQVSIGRIGDKLIGIVQSY